MGNYTDYEKAVLGDERRSKRLARLLEQLSGKPGASVSAACQDPYQAKAVYRFIENDETATDAITKITHELAVERINAVKPAVVLIPQDTTEVNYTGLKETSGLGSIGSTTACMGMQVHSAVAISEMGEIFGLLAQKIWVRPPENFGQSDGVRVKMPIEEKESYKWLETLESASAFLPEGTKAVHICDREGDIFELFCKADRDGALYLCRSTHNRKIEEENGSNKLDNLLDALPSAGKIDIHVPRDSHTDRKARNAELEIKYGECKITKPAKLVSSRELPESIKVYSISAVEIDPPQGEKGICWKLVTNVPTGSFEDAVARIAWYTQRWKIETFHRTLKSGCKVEELQFDTADKLMKLIAIYSIIALDIMLLTYIARAHPDESCEICLTEEEWKILYRVANRTRSIPEKPPTIYEAVVLIARLGGFLARKSDGYPGVTVIWRGLTSFYTILNAIPFLT